MLRPCGRAPSYSGKLIARAVELYLNGVKPGYIRWDELQSALENEFPGEFKVQGQDRPSPETVMGWVRRWPDAPQRLRDLRVQQVEPGSWQPRPMNNPSAYELMPAMPVSPVTSANPWLSALLQQFVAVMVFALMAYCVRAMSWD